MFGAQAVSVVVARPADYQEIPHPLERAAVENAVEARQREFAAGRACARSALHELSGTRPAIPCRRDRSPAWPPQAVGSITHCAGFCAAAAANKGTIDALGLDAEPLAPLPYGVEAMVVSPQERAAFPIGARDWAALTFVAKEAAYKAYYPMHQCFLSFEDVEIRFEQSLSDHGGFSVSLTNSHKPGGDLLARLQGRWREVAGLRIAAAWASSLGLGFLQDNEGVGGGVGSGV